MKTEINTGNISFNDIQCQNLHSTSKYMDIFGFFYYWVSALFAIGSIILLILGLFFIAIILALNCILSILIASNLFKSSEKILLASSNESCKSNLILGFKRLIKFFWYYGLLILINIFWIFII